MIHDIDLDHVAVASERAGDAFPRYTGDLAGRWLGGGATVGYSSFQVEYANGVRVEVLEPHLVEQNDFLRRFLDRNGPGPHHITYKVVDILAALAEVEGAGYRPVNVDVSHPYWKEAFIHPKDGPGVLVQLAQSAGGGGDEWRSPVPDDLARPRTDEPATLVHVAHAVRRLDDGLRLFRLLGGAEAGAGEGEDHRWVDLGWPGSGVVRLLAPKGDGPIGEWVGEAAGRVHHLLFDTADPKGVGDAEPVGDGRYEIRPEVNLGTRLLLDEKIPVSAGR